MIPAHRVIPGVLAEIIRKAPLSPEKVAFAWRTAVGPAVARATEVRLGAEGVLHVRTETPAWAQEVRRTSSLVLSRLAALLGPDVVRRLEFD